jgi:hypothetical protein
MNRNFYWIQRHGWRKGSPATKKLPGTGAWQPMRCFLVAATAPSQPGQDLNGNRLYLSLALN